MKVIIAGSRHLTNPYYINRAWIDSKFEITEVVSGCCYGVDKLGEHIASQKNIPIKRFPADWNKYGKIAGPIRNKQMAEYADALILIWDGKSKGSSSMLNEAKKRKLKIYEIKI